MSRRATTNTFNEGMIKDLNPLNTPNNVLTDALNATFITYNGNEFVLQNDMGNCKVERAKLSVGFIPIGMTEYGGIVYVASYNPETKEGELGAFPSPEKDFDTNDFENLAPVKFKTSDYIVNTNGPIVNEKTSVITKLVEPELLQLNPGDMFLVTYDINVPAAGAGDNVNNKIKMDQYISKDIADRKLFKLKFYKITDDNNLSEINPDDLKLVDADDDLEGQYVYFKEKNQGTIAVGLELETLDQFDINVIDTSKRTDENKSAVIEAIGYSDSMVDFQGVKVELSEPSTAPFYIDKTSDVRKVSAKLTELIADSKLIGTITPYSDYALYPKLTRNFNLELGKYASSGADINNIFRYYVGKDYVKIDFDFKFQGDNSNGLVLYAEFYDPWSDYSVVKVIDNPTYYGNNPIVMQLVDEPTTEIFNSTQLGGTNRNLLSTNTDTEYLKTVLNTSGLVRDTATLRKNHFYIVRISGVDIDLTQDPVEYIHYDMYKGMYTNDMFNDVYLLQNTVPETSPLYVADFNSLDFKLDDVKFTSTLKEVSNNNIVPLITTQRDDLLTDGRYFKVSDTALNATPGYKHTREYKNNKNYSIDLKLAGTERVFGDFKEELLTVQTPALVNSNAASGLKPVIVDENYDNDPNITPDSYANWSITALNSRKYQVLTETGTKRSVYAPVLLNSSLQGISYKEVPLTNQFYYLPNGGGPFSDKNPNAVMNYERFKATIRKPDGSTVSANAPDNRGFDEPQMKSLMSSQFLPSRPNTAAILLTSNESTWFYGIDGFVNCSKNDPNGAAPWKRSMMLVRTPDDEWKATKTISLEAMKYFWERLVIGSSVNRNVYVYYPSQTIKANGQITTTVDYPEFNVTTKFSPTAPGTKTYLSKIILKGVSTTKVDFATAAINNYIDQRKGNSIIIDGTKDEIRDGFIPYITSEKVYNDLIDIPNTIISQTADNTVVAKMAAGSNQYTDDVAFKGGRLNHGQLFIENPEYKALVSGLNVSGPGLVEGVAITDSNVLIRFPNSGQEAIGRISSVGKCEYRHQAIDLNPNIAITKI